MKFPISHKPIGYTKLIQYSVILVIVFSIAVQTQMSIGWINVDDANTNDDADMNCDPQTGMSVVPGTTYNGSLELAHLDINDPRWESGEIDERDCFIYDSGSGETELMNFSLTLEEEVDEADKVLFAVDIGYMNENGFKAIDRGFFGQESNMVHYGQDPNTPFTVPIIRVGEQVGILIRYGWNLQNSDGERIQMNYTFSFSSTPTLFDLSHNDGGSGQDIDPNYPATVNFDQLVSGSLGEITENGYYDTYDLYQINITTTGIIRLTTNVSSIQDVEIQDGLNGIGLHPHDDVLVHFDPSSERDFVEWWQYTSEGGLTGALGENTATRGLFYPGLYYVYVIFEKTLNYTFQVSWETQIQFIEQPYNDGVYEGDAQDRYHGDRHEYGTTYQGAIGLTYQLDNYDHYSFGGIIEGELQLLVELLDPKEGDFLNITISSQCFDASIPSSHIEFVVSQVITESDTISLRVPNSQECAQDASTTNKAVPLLRIFTNRDQIHYQFRLDYTPPEETEEIVTSETLELGNSLVIGMIIGLIAAVSVSGYLLNAKYFIDSNKINENIKKELESVFNGKTGSMIILAQNFTGEDEISDIDLDSDFPPELLKEKQILHPVRLAILKLLSKYSTLVTADLRKQLDVGWGEFSSHNRILRQEGYIILEDKFIDNKVSQVISLTPKGIAKYNYVVELLLEYLKDDL